MSEEEEIEKEITIEIENNFLKLNKKEGKIKPKYEKPDKSEVKVALTSHNTYKLMAVYDLFEELYFSNKVCIRAFKLHPYRIPPQPMFGGGMECCRARLNELYNNKSFKEIQTKDQFDWIVSIENSVRQKLNGDYEEICNCIIVDKEGKEYTNTGCPIPMKDITALTEFENQTFSDRFSIKGYEKTYGEILFNNGRVKDRSNWMEKLVGISRNEQILKTLQGSGL